MLHRMSKTLKLVSLAAVVAVFVGAGVACSESGPEKSDPAEYTKAYVQKAIDRYEKDGADAAFAYYNSAASVEGQWYMFIADADDRMVAHGAMPELVGEDFKTVVSPAGYPVGEEMVRDAGEGSWFSYDWPNPETGEDGAKHSWVVRHEGILFGSGYYEAK